MNDFLEEFKILLEKYNVEITKRKDGIVISKNHQEIFFSEDVTKESVKNRWFDWL